MWARSVNHSAWDDWSLRGVYYFSLFPSQALLQAALEWDLAQAQEEGGLSIFAVEKMWGDNCWEKVMTKPPRTKVSTRILGRRTAPLPPFRITHLIPHCFPLKILVLTPITAAYRSP